MTTRHMRGWRRDKSDLRDHRFLEHGGALPPSGDLRAKCSRVEDQGQIGSCTAHGSTSCAEFLYRAQGNPVELSRLMQYYMTRVKVEGTPASEDSGAEVRDAVKSLVQYGCCDEKLWPYDTAKFADAPPAKALADGLKREVVEYLRCNNLNAVKQSITEGFPVVFGFTVYESFMGDDVAKTGIVPMPTPSEAVAGGHCVYVCGYDDARSVVICRNSWGPGWGDKGDFYLPYGYFTTGLATDCWTLRTLEGV